MVWWVPEDDGEREALSEFVGTLAGSAGVDAAGLGQEPGTGSVNSL